MLNDINLYKIELYRIKNRIMISSILGILCAVIMGLVYLDGYKYIYQIDIWENSSQLFTLLFSLIAIVSVGSMMYQEKKNDFFMYVKMRVNKRKYIKCKLIISMLGSGLVIFFISSISLLIIYYLFPERTSYDINKIGADHIASSLYLKTPILYGLLLSLWRGVLAAIITSFGFVLSLYVKNIFVIYVTPFAVVLILHYVLAICNIPAYSIIYSFEPSSLIKEPINFITMLAGPLTITIITIIVNICGVIYEKDYLFNWKSS